METTSLIEAAAKGQTETAKMLIDNGADVNAKNNEGCTASMIAEEFGNTEIVDLIKNQ